MQSPTTRKDPARKPLGWWPLWLALAALALGALLLLLTRPAKREPEAPAPEAAAAKSRSSYRNRARWAPPEAAGPAKGAEPRIGGTIYDMDGGPLEGAVVSATTFQVAGNLPTVASSTKSDARGHFDLRIADGTYYVNADKEGYGPSFVLAQSGDTVSLVLVKSGVVEGRVIDERGAPVSGFTIDVITAVPDDMAATAPLWSKRFDGPDGTFKVTRLPAWPVIIRATAPSYAPAFSPMVAAPAGNTQQISLTLGRGCSLAGRVEDARGNPLPAVFVDAEARAGAGTSGALSMEAAKQAESDAEGRFSLENVPLGHVQVRGYDGQNAVTTVMVEINDCAKVEPVKLTMTAGGGLSGVVRRGDGTPIPRARLTVTNRAIGFINATSDAAGRFRFEQLPAGMVRLEAQEGAQHTVLFVPVKDGTTVEQDVSLFSKGPGELRGRVTAGGRPVAGVQLMIASYHGADKGVDTYYPVTGADGGYRVPGLPEGGYLARVVSTAKVAQVEIKGDNVTTLDLEIKPEPQAAVEP